MNDAVYEIIKRARLFVEKRCYARQEDEGVLFDTYINNAGDRAQDAMVFSAFGIVRFSNFGELEYPENRPFFSFKLNDFVDNRSTVKAPQGMRTHIENIKNSCSEAVLWPVSTYASRCSTLFGANTADGFQINFPLLEKSRTIIRDNAGRVFEGERVMVYQGGYFVQKGDDKFYEASEKSNVPGPYEEGRFYRVKPEGLGNIVDVRDEYFYGMETLIYSTTSVYMPESEQEVIDTAMYINGNWRQQPRVLRHEYYNEPEQPYTFSPIHVDTGSLYLISSMFRGIDFAWLLINPTSRVERFYMINNRDESDICIEAVVAPLNPAIRGYVK